MLLDLYFLLVVEDADGNLVEIIVDLETLEHAKTIAIAEHGVDLEALEASVVIELLEVAKEKTEGDFQVLPSQPEPAVSSGAATGTESVSTPDRSLTVESLEPEIAVEGPETVIEITFGEPELTDSAIEVIDLHG